MSKISSVNNDALISHTVTIILYVHIIQLLFCYIYSTSMNQTSIRRHSNYAVHHKKF